MQLCRQLHPSKLLVVRTIPGHAPMEIVPQSGRLLLTAVKTLKKQHNVTCRQFKAVSMGLEYCAQAIFKTESDSSCLS